VLSLLASGPIGCALANSMPCLSVTNHDLTSLVIHSDPNWDDQVLTYNGYMSVAGLQINLPLKATAVICAFWHEFGLDFYHEGQFTFAEISNWQLEVTRINFVYPPDSLHYQITTQTPTMLAVEVYAQPDD
jgi:hypothetical protein